MVLDAGGAVKAKFLLKLGLEIFLCHFLASPGLLVSPFSVTVADYSIYLEESYIVSSPNQSETLFQSLPSQKRKGLFG